MQEAIFQDWRPEHAQAWGTAPLKLEHSLARSPLFSLDALAELVEAYPAEHYGLVHTALAKSNQKIWREGEIGGMSGRDVISWIGAGTMWLNLRNVQEVDARYGALLDQIFEELAGFMPGFSTFNRKIGILISSPHACVPYHCDLPGQALWQVVGRKRIYLYPAAEPYLPQSELEKIALYGVETNMAYDPAYDADAMAIDLEPGQMITWPLNAPHRVDNYDMLNVSVTTEHWTQDIRRSLMVTSANGVLRNYFGLNPRRRTLHGAAYVAKAALQAGWRRTPWMKAERRRQRPIDFRLDASAPGRIVDIPAYVR